MAGMPDEGSAPDAPLTRFLVGDADAEPSLADLRAVGLVGHAFARLPTHPQRVALREGFLATAANHLAARRALATLIAAWNARGVVPLVFKGFHLAEFVYPSAGQRAYADVDAFVEEALVPIACAAAAAAGWRVVWRVDGHDHPNAEHGSEYLGHEAATLHEPASDARVDLHRRVVHNVHNRLPPDASARRLTEAFAAAAVAQVWEGATLRLPQPADAAVFGLALNRCWGSDGWRIKPRDYADLEALRQRHDLTGAQVLARARALGVAGTVALYLDRCDPGARRLDLRPPSWWALRRWNLVASRERGAVDPPRAAMALRDATVDGAALARTLPVVADTVRRLRRDPGWRPRAVEPTAGAEPTLGSWSWRTARRAVHRSLKLLRVPQSDVDRAATIAAYRLLARRHPSLRIVMSASEDGLAAPRLVHADRLVPAVAPGVEPR